MTSQEQLTKKLKNKKSKAGKLPIISTLLMIHVYTFRTQGENTIDICVKDFCEKWSVPSRARIQSALAELYIRGYIKDYIYAKRVPCVRVVLDDAKLNYFNYFNISDKDVEIVKKIYLSSGNASYAILTYLQLVSIVHVPEKSVSFRFEDFKERLGIINCYTGGTNNFRRKVIVPIMQTLNKCNIGINITHFEYKKEKNSVDIIFWITRVM